MEVPFIDIFAGPGGLSEGFSRFSAFNESEVEFVSRLAIEKEEVAVETLRLRSFFRQFRDVPVPEQYYKVLRQQAPLSSLWNLPEWKVADEHVWKAELGVVDEKELHEKLVSKLEDAPTWVLLGGPPCQAYSLMGRARMTGIGNKGRNALGSQELDQIKEKITTKFVTDKRHFLYQEYLRIVAVHQPSIFVMENVMGILSAMLPAKQPVEGESKDDEPPKRRVFDQIKKDLTDPWAALADDPKVDVLTTFHRGPKYRYRLHSFVVARDEYIEVDIADRDYLIKAELFGLPQKRHRVIILGVREDIKAKPGVLQKVAAASVKETIGDLPKLRSGLSRNDIDFETWRVAIDEAHRSLFGDRKSPVAQEIIQLTHMDGELNRGTPFTATATATATSDDGHPTSAVGLSGWLTDTRLKGVLQHQSRGHMPSDLVRYLYVASQTKKNGISPKISDWPAQLIPDHKNVSIDAKTRKLQAEGFNDRFKAQAESRPSSTVTSHIAKDGHFFIHPDPLQCRSLTVREAARLQTFPDNYYFCGNKTQQYHQIGNAVPPYLAVQLAKVVADLISEEERLQEKK